MLQPLLRSLLSPSAPNQAEGRFVRTWPDGSPREAGDIEAGQRSGTWRCYAEDGTLVQEQSYRKGLVHGPVTRWFATGILREETQRAWGILNGPFARFHPNGRLAEDGEHIEGRVHRAYCRWWPNGRKRIEGEFHHGVPVGLWRVWDGHGNHVYEGPWRSDLRAQLGPELSSALRRSVPQDTPRSVGYRHGTYANVA